MIFLNPCTSIFKENLLARTGDNEASRGTTGLYTGFSAKLSVYRTHHLNIHSVFLFDSVRMHLNCSLSLTMVFLMPLAVLTSSILLGSIMLCSAIGPP